MSSVKQTYGASGTAIAITIASLANNASRQSDVVDNTSDLFLDALVTLKVKSNAAGTGATGWVLVYAFGTADGGTNYQENAGIADAAITLTAPANMRLIGVLNVVANATTYRGLFNVAAAFGGVMPAKWGIVLTNQSGAALDATGGSHSLSYQGIYASVA